MIFSAVKDLFGGLSVACGAIGYAGYIRSVLRQRTKPHLFSWLIWGLLCAIIFGVQFSKQAGAGDWAAGFTGVVCFFIAGLAVPYGEKKITRSDYIALFGALAALGLWVVTQQPLLSVILVMLTDLLGSYPTWRKSYLRPHEEMALMYVMDVLKYTVSLAAMQIWTLEAVLFPLFVIVTNSAFVFVLLARRKRMAP